MSEHIDEDPMADAETVVRLHSALTALGISPHTDIVHTTTGHRLRLTLDLTPADAGQLADKLACPGLSGEPV